MKSLFFILVFLACTGTHAHAFAKGEGRGARRYTKPDYCKNIHSEFGQYLCWKQQQNEQFAAMGCQPDLYDMAAYVCQGRSVVPNNPWMSN